MLSIRNHLWAVIQSACYDAHRPCLACSAVVAAMLGSDGQGGHRVRDMAGSFYGQVATHAERPGCPSTRASVPDLSIGLDLKPKGVESTSYYTLMQCLGASWIISVAAGCLQVVSFDRSDASRPSPPPGVALRMRRMLCYAYTSRIMIMLRQSSLSIWSTQCISTVDITPSLRILRWHICFNLRWQQL